MMRYRYDTKRFPSSPVIEITCINVAEGLRTEPLTALIDTGADATIVPIHFLREIYAPQTIVQWLRSHWGERRQVFLYLIDVAIEDVILPGIQVVGDPFGDEIIAGRDILNRLRILLDGPAKITEVYG
jgi:predicted aspartyl protease